jgi:anaerobic ribonucleoside-triphosphate reductase
VLIRYCNLRGKTIVVKIQRRARGVKVLKAISSPLRLQILNLIFDKGPLSYTELMNSLKMNPSRDAGRFAYHLKFLLKADLLEANTDSKKYVLTDLGKIVLDVADRVEKKADKPRGMLVRTSHFTLEDFDSNKIANSLIKEAKVTPELAKKAAKEAEKRLRKSKTKYLTAPLIREVVNTILVEKGFEDYRHKLTRLGMPVHEVTSLIGAKDSAQDSDSVLSKAGKTVLSEYTLLNVFPRDIADAYVSGAIHVKDLGTWILKPNEVMHDLRFFLQHGIKWAIPLHLSTESPQTFESALSLIFNILLHTSREIDELQTIDYFNVFLAPFVKDADVVAVKENLRRFILNVNQNTDATLGLEPLIPKSVAGKTAVGPNGKTCGKYRDFVEESQLLASLTIEVSAEENVPKPLLNPRLVLKLSKDTLMDEKAKAILLKAHSLATEHGTIYFANTIQKGAKQPVFSASGCKLEADLTGDWETDTLRTGCLGVVTVNLSRILHESEKDQNKFFEILKERFELAARALKIKYRALRVHGKNLLPFMMQRSNGDTYFKLENCSRIVNFAGFTEAVESFCGKNLSHEETVKFAEKLIQNLLVFKRKLRRRHGKRLFPTVLCSLESSKRLAQLDIEKYGVAKVRFSGTRDKPFYSTTRRLKLKNGDFPYVPSEALELEYKLKGLNAGGSLSIIELDGNEYQPEQLLKLTEHVIKNDALEFFTYNRVATYCDGCRKSWFGVLHKCPSCGSMSTLTTFNRFAHT